MSSRRRIGLVSRRQPDRLIKQEFDNLMNEIDSAEGSSDRVEDVPDVPVPILSRLLFNLITLILIRTMVRKVLLVLRMVIIVMMMMKKFRIH